MSLVVDIQKDLGHFHLNVQLEGGDEVIALLGSSGCGKSMTLRCIAGVEQPDRGHIEVDGVTLFDSRRHICLTSQQRRVGLLFQNYALFPSMTVQQNIAAGARREKDAVRRAGLVSSVIESFDLKDLVKHYPHQLSGGQQQRVALARLLVSGPHALLLDESFSALDSHLRFRMEQEVRGIIRDFGKTVVLVSHDRDEVYHMSDHIVVMNDGHVERAGSRHDVFRAPGTRSAAILTGCKNVAVLEPAGERLIRVPECGLTLATSEPVGDARYVGIRMHDIHAGDGENSVPLTVTSVVENPFSFIVMLRAEALCRDRRLLQLFPYKHKKIGVIVTGFEVYHGRIKDKFEPVVRAKMQRYPAEILGVTLCDDDVDMITEAGRRYLDMGAELLIFTGGMSVDPDDLTPPPSEVWGRHRDPRRARAARQHDAGGLHRRRACTGRARRGHQPAHHHLRRAAPADLRLPAHHPRGAATPGRRRPVPDVQDLPFP